MVSIQGFTNLSHTSWKTAALTWEKMLGGISPLLLTISRTITVAGNLICVTLGTSTGSLHNHQSFPWFTFGSNQNFCHWRKNKAFQHFSLFSKCFTQIKQFSLASSDINFPPYITYDLYQMSSFKLFWLCTRTSWGPLQWHWLTFWSYYQYFLNLSYKIKCSDSIKTFSMFFAFSHSYRISISNYQLLSNLHNKRSSNFQEAIYHCITMLHF